MVSYENKYNKDKEVRIKNRHIKMKGTLFSSKINYHYNIFLNKVSRSLALSLSKIAVFLEDLSLCVFLSVSGRA